YYSEELAQKIYASCDAFLMPSLFEPCGLSQLMSMRYGTVPLVRETGGLKDTVEPYNEFEHTGTGFSFHNYNAHEMLYMIRYACKVFSQTPEEWLDIIRRDMEQDFSWEVSCERYSLLYDALIAEEEKRTREEERIRREQEQKEQQRREEEMMLRIRLEKEMQETAEAEQKAAEEKAAAEAKRKAAEAKRKAAKKQTAAKAKRKPASKTASTSSESMSKTSAGDKKE
ncbi:MAG: glycosyltransferase, partial [Clostridiales bacterium]|nr:glycosyltransferase [Clostridiales bacterium]